MNQPRRIAAIDLGTNTTLMLVAEADAANALRVLEDRATITRLGRGVDRTSRLDETAIERTLAVLSTYAESARGWNAPVVAVGTSALRDASNRDEFLAPAEALLGCEIRAIGGVEEAELTFRGALEGITIGSEPITVVDVGGGSTEIIVGADGVVQERVSLNIGSVRMHERHGLGAPTSPSQVDAVRDDVRRILAAASFHPAPRLLAIAGTATTVAAMVGEIEPYDPARVHGLRVTRDQLRAQAQRLIHSTIDARRQIKGLHPDRADVIAAGVIILEEILAWAGAQALIASDGGVRFGLARTALAKIGAD